MKRVVVTPGVCWGAPRLDGTRLSTDGIKCQFRAGDSIATIASDYGIAAEDVEEALRFGLMTPAKRRKYLAGGES